MLSFALRLDLQEQAVLYVHVRASLLSYAFLFHPPLGHVRTKGCSHNGFQTSRFCSAIGGDAAVLGGEGTGEAGAIDVSGSAAAAGRNNPKATNAELLQQADSFRDRALRELFFF